MTTGADGLVLHWRVPPTGPPTHSQRHLLTWQGPLMGSGSHEPTIGRAVGGTALAVAPGCVAVGCEDGTVVLLNDAREDVAAPPAWHAHVAAVTGLHWLDGSRLASTGADGGVTVWSVDPRKVGEVRLVHAIIKGVLQHMLIH